MKTKFTEWLKIVSLVFLVLITCMVDAQHFNINTIAGNGAKGFSRESCLINSKLSLPSGVTFDGRGQMLLTDQGNPYIHDYTDAIITRAGNRAAGFSRETIIAHEDYQPIRKLSLFVTPGIPVQPK